MTNSKEHLLYLKNEKRIKISVIIIRILILISFFALWQVLSDTKLIDPFLFSSPTRIIKTFISLLKEDNLILHIATTLYETLLGFIIASILGMIIAVIFWWSNMLNKIFEPYIVVLNSLPKIALGPLIIIWFGSGTKAIVFMVVIITIIVTIINMLASFNNCDNDKILLLKSMGANKLQIFIHLVLPYSLPAILSTLKINVGMSWIGSIMGEYLVSKQGIGYLIVYGGQVFKLDLVMTSTIILCVLSGLMYFGVALLEKKLLKWQ